jgi:putative tryptophan/tyrosine transport system substrate-binding protein
VRNREELEHALPAMMQERPLALLMTGDTVLQGQIDRILAFAAKNRLPTVHQLRDNTEAGGLMSYGTSRPALIRRAHQNTRAANRRGVAARDQARRLPRCRGNYRT